MRMLFALLVMMMVAPHAMAKHEYKIISIEDASIWIREDIIEDSTGEYIDALDYDLNIQQIKDGTAVNMAGEKIPITVEDVMNYALRAEPE